MKTQYKGHSRLSAQQVISSLEARTDSKKVVDSWTFWCRRKDRIYRFSFVYDHYYHKSPEHRRKYLKGTIAALPDGGCHISGQLRFRLENLAVYAMCALWSLLWILGLAKGALEYAVAILMGLAGTAITVGVHIHTYLQYRNDTAPLGIVSRAAECEPERESLF